MNNKTDIFLEKYIFLLGKKVLKKVGYLIDFRSDSEQDPDPDPCENEKDSNCWKKNSTFYLLGHQL